MPMPRRLSCLASLAVALVVGTGQALASATCPAERPAPLLPADPAQCAALLPAIRAPHALPLDQYEAKLGAYLRDFCYRDPAAGWHTDKAIRDTGPYTARLVGGEWVGTYYGTHAPVIVWYSPDMFAWMRANRAEDPAARPAHPAPVPDGAIMIKEMYPAPPPPAAGSTRYACCRPAAPRSWCAMLRLRMTAGSGAGSAGTNGRPTGRPNRRRGSPIWVSVGPA